jgi:serine/alanine adding enzyme
MLRCVAFGEDMREAWDRLASMYGTVFHTIAFRRILLDSFDYRCGYHALIDDRGCFHALIPLVAGRNLGLKRTGVSLPFVNYLDICADGDEARRQALEAIPDIQEKLGLDVVELRLKDHNIDRPGWQSYLQNFTFSLPLPGDEESALAQTSASCRNHVRKTHKNEWFTVSFDSGRLPDFYAVYVRRMKQLGSPSPSFRFFANFFRHLPDHTFLLTVLDRQTDRVIGGMLLLKSPANATLYYPYGANLVEYNSQYLNSFMYWAAVRFGIRQGMKFLDLGRSPAGSGTYRYKLQWGARPEQLKYMFYGNSDGKNGPADRERLRFFITLWKVMPDFFTDPIGKKLITYIMP